MHSQTRPNRSLGWLLCLAVFMWGMGCHVDDGSPLQARQGEFGDQTTDVVPVPFPEQEDDEELEPCPDETPKDCRAVNDLCCEADERCHFKGCLDPCEDGKEPCGSACCDPATQSCGWIEDGFCVDHCKADEQPCGAAGACCGDGEVCDGGWCQPLCEGGAPPCGGKCCGEGSYCVDNFGQKSCAREECEDPDVRCGTDCCTAGETCDPHLVRCVPEDHCDETEVVCVAGGDPVCCERAMGCDWREPSGCRQVGQACLPGKTNCEQEPIFRNGRRGQRAVCCDDATERCDGFECAALCGAGEVNCNGFCCDEGQTCMSEGGGCCTDGREVCGEDCCDHDERCRTDLWDEVCAPACDATEVGCGPDCCDENTQVCRPVGENGALECVAACTPQQSACGDKGLCCDADETCVNRPLENGAGHDWESVCLPQCPENQSYCGDVCCAPGDCNKFNLPYQCETGA